MTEQLSVFVTERGQIVSYRLGERSLAENFARFHQENPHVYSLLVRLAREWRARRPGTRCGIGMLYEVARWYEGINSRGEPLKLNNNYRAFYARMMMEREPDLDLLFDLRAQQV